MTFVFVTPLKGKNASNNGERTQRLCQQTILSMLASGPAARIILVCNEIPNDLPQDSRLTVASIVTPFPRTNREKMEDKYAKLSHGLAIARQFAPCWLMRADADDLVSYRLVEFAIRAEPAKHCVVESGWVWKQGSRFLVRQRNFHRFCGTSLASRVDAVEFPNPLLPERDCWLLNGHHVVVDQLRALGHSMVSVPFPSVIYRVSHGENESGDGWETGRSRRRAFYRLFLTRPFTAALKRQFGIAVTTEVPTAIRPKRI
jgi:hypothetical protein